MTKKQVTNLCDGCQRGLPVKPSPYGGQPLHYKPKSWGYNDETVSYCTKDRYKQGTEKYGRGWYYDRFVERRRDYKAKTNQSIFSSEGVQYPDETYTNLDIFINNFKFN